MKIIPCNLCSSQQTTKLVEGRDIHLHIDDTLYTVVRCTTCRLAYVNPQPSPEEIAKYYPLKYAPYQKGYEVFSHNRVVDALRSVRSIFKNSKIPQPKNELATDTSEKTALDFGCGSGRFLLSLREEHPRWSLFGFDISTNKEIGRLDPHITIFRDHLENLEQNFTPESFDAIYLNNSLEHVHNPLDVLTRLAILLKKNGQISIEVPNIDSIKFKIFGRYFASLDLPRHLFHFTPKTLTALCEQSGLHVETLTLTGTSKSTLRSIYFMLGIETPQFDPLAYSIIQKIISLIGTERIDDDVIRITALKKII